MSSSLTIAIPTYNRAHHLDRQLRWLATALPGSQDRIGVLISDNASTDDTPEVVDSWRPAFEYADFTYRRHPTNIGAVPNMASCVRFASSSHVWVISDDDVMGEQALEAVLGRLRERPDLGLLTLNHSARYVDGRQRFGRCFPVAAEYYDTRGMDLATFCLDFADAGMGFITAHVFRTDLVQQAQREWPTEENLVVVTYWAAYCAREGGMRLTADTYLECTAGDHFWTKDPVMDLRMHLVDTPELGERLIELGYDPRVCRGVTLRRITPRRVRTLGAAFRVSPMCTLRQLAIFARALWRVGPMQTLNYLIIKLVNRLRRGGQPVDRERMLKVFPTPLSSPPPGRDQALSHTRSDSP